MDRSELTKLLPKDSNDVGNAEILIALGYPTVGPVLKALLQWIDAGRSPVEAVVIPFFAALGEPALELVRDALSVTTKPARKEKLLRQVLPQWPADTVSKLESELCRFLQYPDFHGLDVWALLLMIENGIESHEGNERWRALKIERMTEMLAALQR